ncbi:MAG TPA: hypothetical protein VK615_04030 [Candidatus Binatia bacterium]|nr:hypothetical protein [Candidatus Binatia bacterium]
MKLSALSLGFVVTTLVLGFSTKVDAQGRAKLSIQHDRANKRVIISWDGAGNELGQRRGAGARYERTSRISGPVSVDTTAEQMSFALLSTAADSVVSENVVGYVNVDLPWGMSLIGNPLLQTNMTLGYLFPTAPDGAQVLVLVGNDYDSSVFSAATMSWSKPWFELALGRGFFFVNPSRTAFTQTFVGEVLTGSLTNPLPAGVSLKASLIPQAGSINTLHNIPGQPGDNLFTYFSDAEARGRYIRSTFTATNAWVPDQDLGVAKGFWIQKKQAQDWVRFFSVFP